MTRIADSALVCEERTIEPGAQDRTFCVGHSHWIAFVGVTESDLTDFSQDALKGTVVLVEDVAQDEPL